MADKIQLNDVLDDLFEMVDEVGSARFAKMFLRELIDRNGREEFRAIVLDFASYFVDSTDSRLVRAGRSFIEQAANASVDDLYEWCKT